MPNPDALQRHLNALALATHHLTVALQAKAWGWAIEQVAVAEREAKGAAAAARVIAKEIGARDLEEELGASIRDLVERGDVNAGQ